MDRKGFTLVELLIAATIIGILAVFATAQYRNSAAETRWAAAKARADQLAYAVYQVAIEYPNLKFSKVAMAPGSTGSNCAYPSNPSGTYDPASLVTCGYLDNSGWSDKEYFLYYVCKGNDNCGSEDALVVVTVNEWAKLPASYKSYRYYAKVKADGKEVK